MIRILIFIALLPLPAFAAPVFSESMIYAAQDEAPVPPGFHSITIEEAQLALQNAASANCGAEAIRLGAWNPSVENRMSYGRQIYHLSADFTCP